MITYQGLNWHPSKTLKMAEFKVGVKRTIITLHVKVSTQLESLDSEFPSGRYEFSKGAATDQIWTTTEDQPLQAQMQIPKRHN